MKHLYSVNKLTIVCNCIFNFRNNLSRINAVFLIFLLFMLFTGCLKNDPPNNNKPPEDVKKTNLAPKHFNVNTSVIKSNTAKVSWDIAVDPEKDNVTYSVYLNNALISKDLTTTSYDLTNLLELTTYNGKVVAKDAFGNETSETFSFTTRKYYLQYIKGYDYATTLGGSPYSMVKTTDGGYVVAGRTYPMDQNAFQFFVLKIDALGNQIWKKFYDYRIYNPTMVKIIQSRDNGFILTSEHYVLKINSTGDLVWSKKIASYEMADASSQIKSVAEDNNGNIYIVGGRGAATAKKFQAAVLTKLDNTGNVIWEKVFNPSIRDYFDDIIITSSNELMILGSTESEWVTYEQAVYGPSSVEKIDFWVLKTTIDGDILWQKTYGDVKYDFPVQLIATSDGNYVFTGFSWDEYDHSSRRLFKISPSGTEIWNSMIGTFSASISSVAETPDKGFVTTGYVGSGSNQMCLFKYDSNGAPVLEKIYQEDFTWFGGKAILSTSDGGYMIAFVRYDAYNSAINKIWIIKTDPDGNYE